MEWDATVIRFPIERRLRAERERQAARIASMLRHPSNVGAPLRVAPIPGPLPVGLVTGDQTRAVKRST